MTPRRPPALPALLVLAACSSKARPLEDTRTAGSASAGSAGSGSGSAGSGSAGSGSGSAGSASAAPTLGDVQLRVEWANVPAAARTSPGRTPCNTPRAPAVSPTATWGIPDAFVIVDGAPAPTALARAVLADCALAPLAAVGPSLIVESAVDRPATVLLARRVDLSTLAAAPATPAASPPRALRLPIAGHAVAVPLDPGSAYELSTSDRDPEAAWLLAPAPGTVAAVTDAAGQVVLRALSPGAHAVTAWLPPRAGQPARLARGAVTVVAGQLAELTLQLTAP